MKASEAAFADKQLSGGHLLIGIGEVFIGFSHISQEMKTRLILSPMRDSSWFIVNSQLC